MSRTSTATRKLRENCLPPAEARLLKLINRGFADDWWERYHALVSKRQESTLTSDELQELIRVTDELEKQEANRLQALVKLAKLRKQPLAGVMKSLDLSKES